jgi:cytidine deaminase
MVQICETKQVSWRLHGEIALGFSNRLAGIESIALAQLESARSAARMAYAPYSNFRVGASVLSEKDGKKGEFNGCNIENASYGATMCAERVALFSAISKGYREIEILALSTLDSMDAPELSHRSPCGLCRQVMSEFFSSDTMVLIDGGKNAAGINCVDLTAIDTLLPWRFDLTRAD